MIDTVDGINHIQSRKFNREELREDESYVVEDYCKDALGFSEDALIAKIDRDNLQIRTVEQGYYRDLEEDLRNRFTGIRLIEKLEKLDGLRRQDNSGGVR